MKYNFMDLFAVLILCYFLIKKKVSKKNFKLPADNIIYSKKSFIFCL